MATPKPGAMKVQCPKAILFDMVSTVAKTSFIDKVLMPYIPSYIKTFLEENWNSTSVQTDIANLRFQAQQEPSAPQLPLQGDRDSLMANIVAYVNYCIDNNKESAAMTLLRFHMWFDGFKKGRLETPVYSDVAKQLNKWHTEQNVMLYILSNGWAAATKRFLSKTNHGDLNALIADHFDSSDGELNDPLTYRKVLDKMQASPDDVLFLTKNEEEGLAARKAGLGVILVLTHRRNIEKLGEEGKKLPRIRSFNDLELVSTTASPTPTPT